MGQPLCALLPCVAAFAHPWLVAGLLCCALLLVWAQPALAGPELPDSFDAAQLETTPDGMLLASGGAVLNITTMVAGATVRVEAETAEYDPRTGYAALAGGVVITLVEYGFSIECSSFTYDPVMGEAEVEGLEVGVPFSAVMQQEEVLFASRMRSGKHFYNFNPDAVYVAAGRAHFSTSATSAETADFVLEDVRLTHSSRKDPDLYVTADELTLTPDGQAVLRGIAVHISQFSLGKWPRVSRRLEPKPGMFSFGVPQFGFDRDSGMMVKEHFVVDLHAAKIDSLLDYGADYGLRISSYAYVEPVPGAQLGVSYGSRSLMDIKRQSFSLTEDYNFVARQRFKEHGKFIDDAWYILEYGSMGLTPEDNSVQAGTHAPAVKVEDTRTAAQGNAKFALIPLGGDLYLATGATARWVRYQDAKQEYRVLGGEAGLVWLHGGFDHFIMYVQNQERGVPVMSFDEVRHRELDFATSIRLHPEWRHVIRGVYDFDRDEFNTLEIGAMKRQKSYEIGLYWDVARNNAGVELGLLMN